MLNKYITFVKAHETLVLGIGLLLVILSLGNKWLDHSSQKAAVNLGAAQQVVTQDQSQNKALAAQLAAQQAQYAKLAQTTAAQVAGLQAQIQAGDAQVKTQQQADQGLGPADLAKRWADLLQLAPSDVVPSLNDTMVVSKTGALTTTTVLEQIPALVKDRQDLETETTAQKGQLDDLQKVNDLFTKQVMGLQGQLVDADKACKAQVTNVKAQARKGKLKWFGAGFVLGVVSKRLLLGSW